MQPRTLKLAAFSLIGLSLVLAVAGIRLSQQPAPTDAEALAPESPYKVLVASRDISPNTVLTEDDVQSIPYPLSTGGTFTEVEAVVGKEVYSTLHQGEVLRKEHFELESILSEQVTPGHRAMAVTVDETAGTGGYLLPGDKVDVFFATRANRETGNQSVARRILNDVTVLAFGNLVKGGDDVEEPSGKRSRTAVLEVPEAESSKLFLAETAGSLRLAAVGDREIGEKATSVDPVEPSENRATMRDVTGAPQQARRPQSRVYVYHGDSVETVRTNP